MERAKQIPLIDDSPVVAGAVREALEPFGYRVAWVEDGAGLRATLTRSRRNLNVPVLHCK